MMYLVFKLHYLLHIFCMVTEDSLFTTAISMPDTHSIFTHLDCHDKAQQILAEFPELG